MQTATVLEQVREPVVDSQQFRRACSKFATGIAVATVRGGAGQPYGLTINSFTSVSLHPPLVLISVAHRCSVLPHFLASSHFAVNVLTEEQRDLSVRFAECKGDRFEGVTWAPGVSGAPALSGSLAVLECRFSQSVDAGDHTLVIGEVINAEYGEGNPLLYFNSRYAKLSK